MSTVKIKINKWLPGYKVGQVLQMDCDDEGTPFSIYWQRRLKDARTDGCCEIVRPPQKTKSAPKAAPKRTTKSKTMEDES